MLFLRFIMFSYLIICSHMFCYLLICIIMFFNNVEQFFYISRIHVCGVDIAEDAASGLGVSSHLLWKFDAGFVKQRLDCPLPPGLSTQSTQPSGLWSRWSMVGAGVMVDERICSSQLVSAPVLTLETALPLNRTQ